MSVRSMNEYILTQLDELVSIATDVASDLDHKTQVKRQHMRVIVAGPLDVGDRLFIALRTRVVNIVARLEDIAPHLASLRKKIETMQGDVDTGEEILGILHGLRSDVAAGLLESFTRRVEDNVVADYLTMAERLLAGEPGSQSHIPAAVLAGAVLEDALRRLCQRQQPPLTVAKDNGEPKMMNALIDDLRKADVLNELKAKQLRAWADIRNAAAHGRFDEVKAFDVTQMLSGVGQFLADYL